MKIIQKDLKHSIVKLLITNLDDLWALYNLISTDDRIYAKTTRELKIERTGRPSSRRISTFLGINVEKIFFDREVCRLRVHGRVIESPEELNIHGKYHTLNLVVGGSTAVVKDHWLKYQIKNLEDLEEKEKPIIIVAIDYDECCIALSRIYGIDVKAELKSRLPGKLELEKRATALGKYFRNISRTLERTSSKNDGKIVIVGPGFIKDNLLNYVKNYSKELTKEIDSVKSVSSGGISGVYEALRVGIVDNALKRIRIVKESALVEEVFRRLGASTGDIAYGLDEVTEDAMAGAVNTMMVCDETLRKQDEDNRLKLEEAMKNVENSGGKTVVVSSEHEGGAKLKSLGGVAALLRYARHLESH